MRIKSIITFALLFSISLSVVHEYTFDFYENEHMNVEEYISEFKDSNNHGDICDIHFEYHMVYILPSKVSYKMEILQQNLFTNINERYLSFYTSKIYKPPIS